MARMVLVSFCGGYLRVRGMQGSTMQSKRMQYLYSPREMCKKIGSVGVALKKH